MGAGEWMEPPNPDGLPVYYPHQLQPGLPAGYYSPQTEHGAVPEPQQLPAHGQSVPSDPRTALAQPPNQAPDAPQSYQPPTLMSPSVSSCADTPSADGSSWSSPDREAEFDGYSYHGSPAIYNQAPVSPQAPFSSPMQMPFRTADNQQSAGFQQARMCSPVSDGSPHTAQNLYPHTSHPFGTLAHSPLTSMPSTATASMTTTTRATTSVPAQFVPLSPEGPSEVSGTPEEGEEGGHEPYSKQLVRALMSFPGHAATVQQIYDWFEANTNRAESAGWKNSIRHNLSLNEAFVKRACSAPEGEESSGKGGGAKRGNEWVLMDWAATGIQSTAKYRPKNKGPKVRARVQPLSKAGVAPRGHDGGRKLSGRRGGCATSMMKQRRQSQPTTAARSDFPPPPPPPPPAAHWVSIPEGGSGGGAPLTPASTPDDFGLAGAGVMDPGGYCIDLSGYQLGDVAGVWDGGRLFAGDFRAIHEQLQWQTGVPGATLEWSGKRDEDGQCKWGLDGGLAT